MAKIVDHKYSIEEAFRECFYIVPDYQREYVWTDREVNQLLDDINDELDAANGREYFIGTILVSEKADQKNRNQSQGGQSQAADLIHSRSGCCSLNEAFIAFTST